ncbi:MAG: hypothetical protein RI911_782 [Candidatus Parcubacteria bacterium]|jgi:peptidoglycan hydrolase-like protein with peptidoglycan-binding domain
MMKYAALGCVLTMLLCGAFVSAQSTKVITTKTTEKKEEKKECPKFTEVLYFGATDKETKGEVTRLQEWLRNYPAMYPSGVVNGTYTEEVELAVRRVQKRYSLVTPGLSCKTGYGIVEEKTREYLNKNLSCEPISPRERVSCGNLSCPNLTRTLSRGMADPEGILGEVAMLQCYLAGRGVLAPALINGAFGPSTERAVLQYQQQVGIPQTGSVNAQTRSSIGKCGKSTPGGQQSKSQRYSFFIKPSSGEAPLTIALSFALNGTTCSSYQVDWGDGTAPLDHDAGRPSTCTEQPITLFERHTYTKAGSYTITLKHGQDTLGRIPVVNQAQITVR